MSNVRQYNFLLTYSFLIWTDSFLLQFSWTTACVLVTISTQLEHRNMKSPFTYDLSVALYCEGCEGVQV